MPQSLFNLKRLRILTVGGSRALRATIAAYLDRWNVRHDAVETPEAAMAKLRGAVTEGLPFTVALLAQGPPVRDSVALASSIKAEPGIERTVLVALPENEDCGDTAELKAAGVAAVLPQGFDGSALFDAILQVSSSHGPRRADGSGSGHRAGAGGAGARHLTRVLLVDDNELNQVMAGEVLKTAGYDCDVVTSGGAAVDAVLRVPYDLVLMDCQMPGMDGFEATRRIREAEARGDLPGRREKRLPIVALTSESELSCRDPGRRAGMDDYLGKPFDPRLLIETVDYYVGGGVSSEPGQRRSGIPSGEREPGFRMPPSEAPLDLDAMLRTCLGRQGVLRKVLGKFAELGPAMAEQLEAAVARRDVDQIVFAAHALKGSAGNVSARRLRDLAATVERLARDRCLGDLPVTVTGLRVELAACVDQAERFLVEEQLETRD